MKTKTNETHYLLYHSTNSINVFIRIRKLSQNCFRMDMDKKGGETVHGKVYEDSDIKSLPEYPTNWSNGILIIPESDGYCAREYRSGSKSLHIRSNDDLKKFQPGSNGYSDEKGSVEYFDSADLEGRNPELLLKIMKYRAQMLKELRITNQKVDLCSTWF